MNKTSQLTNENGSVIVLAVIMLVLLTLLGMAVTRTSSIEVQIASNDQQAVDDFYRAESADHWAIEIYNTWMTDAFLTADPNSTVATWTGQVDTDGVGGNDTTVEIRCILFNGGVPVTIAGLTPGANDLPVQQHTTVPPVGSGNSLGKFEVRKYGITARQNSGVGTLSQVQLGTYKVFNKFN